MLHPILLLLVIISAVMLAARLIRRHGRAWSIHRARRGFRQNYIEWKRTGSAAARLNVEILAARLREMGA